MKKMSRIVTVTALVLVAACAAEGPAGGEPDPTPPPSGPEAEPPAPSTTPPSTSPPTTPSPFDPLIEAAVADLAARLQVDEGDVRVALVEEVTWSDGSLGCPEPGKLYTQALVPGVRIVLGYADILYDYHQGGNSRPFLCEEPVEPLAP